jgi:N-acetylglucosaminyl-diphospho-decaprenol L-rhamnosyltransferase
VRVAGVVVSHGHREELAESLAALVPQVDEVVVIANTPASGPADPLGARVIENARPASFAANINAGTRATSGELVLVSNPDAVPEQGAIAALREFVEAHPRCGAAGPQLVDPDGSRQPSRRRFPTVGGTLVRRTPLRRLLRRAMLDERGGFDEGFRMYGEEIDLCYRAAKAGWERWYVPAAVVHHRWDAATDKSFFTRRTLWHWRGILRFVRKHPERLKAL